MNVAPNNRLVSRGLLHWKLAAALSALVLLAIPAYAVPSFARQTGATCAACHVSAFGPSLNTYGRLFKLNGYVWGASQKLPALSAMVLGSWTATASAQAGGAAAHFGDNNNAALDQLSLFYAGRIGPYVGAFVQATYSGVDRASSWDNLDVRAAHQVKLGSHSVLLGGTVNNNPTVTDPWSSVGAWAQPYVASGLAPGPIASPAIAGALGQQVLGATVYAMLDSAVYLEFGGYQQLADRWQRRFGIDTADQSTVVGTAPYWRVAIQHQVGAHYGAIGLIGLNARVHPGGDASAGTDAYTDVGVDGSYQYIGTGSGFVEAHFSSLHERQQLRASTALGGSDGVINTLDSLQVDATYTIKQTYALTAGLFNLSGTGNSSRYAEEPIAGSRTGRPSSRGYELQFEWIPFGKAASYGAPWLNLRTGLAYTGYARFNGAATNYDGSGRSAHDNNSLYGFAWLMF